MGDQPLREAASALDEKLRRCRFQTLVHGDAKVENFCFTPKGDRVAVVDFQYVGGGCGMKDVAYFLSSCLSADECVLRESELLDAYFGVLRTELGARMPEVQIAALVDEWRTLYPVAWADFNRFLAGWAPGHYKRHHYCDALTARALAEL